MKAIDLKPGDETASGKVLRVRSAPQSDRVIVDVEDEGRLRSLYLFKHEEVNNKKLLVDREAILDEYVEVFKRDQVDLIQLVEPSSDIVARIVVGALIVLWDKEPDALQVFKDKLQARLEFGRKEHGEYWSGNGTDRNVEEELLDALVYLWIGKELE